MGGEGDIRQVLGNYLSGLEQLFPESRTSLLKVQDGHVYNLVANTLPADYIKAIEGLAIGPAEGSCGTAAYEKKLIIVTDIAKDPLWKKYKQVALTAGLQACWSYPVFNVKGEVIATFANYFSTPRKPTAAELEFFTRAGTVISIILENHEKEQTLRQSYERFEYVTKATSDAIWDWNLISDTTFCGEGFTDVIGEPLDQKDWKLSKWLEYAHPDDRSIITQKVEEVLRGAGNRWEQEYRIIRKDGQQAYVSDRAYIIRDERGKPIRIIGAIRDITLKREEEQQLRLLENVVTHTNDAVLITSAHAGSADGPEIIYVNEAFTRMTGYQPEEVAGKTVSILEGPRTDAAELSRLKLAFKLGEPCSVNLINYTKEGKEYRVESVVKPMFNLGRLSHFFAIQRDITQQFKQQQQSRFMEIVSNSFKENESLAHSLSVVLKKLVEFGDFTAAETWLLSPDKRVFNLAASFASTKEAKEYYTENRQLNSLTPEGGLLKDIWTKQELVIVDDFDKHPTLRRRAGVQKAGFKSALAIPLMNRGELIGALTVLTDRKAAHLSEFEQLFKGLEEDLGSEIKRKQLENELSIIFNTAPDIIAVVGYDGYFKRLNPAASVILGYSTEELMSRPYNQFIHPDYIASTDTITASLPTITEANYFENCYITKSGKPVWLGWTYQQIPDEDLVYTVAKDITRQKELQRLLHDATDLARIGAWEMDMATGQINWSDVTREIHEVPTDYQPVLQEIYQYYQESDKPILEQSVTRAINEGIPYDLELLHVTAKGNKRWVRVIGTPEMSRGKCIRIYGSFQDIHARKLAEIELKQRTRYLSAIATVAQIFLSNEDWFDGVKNSFDLARYTMLADQIFYKEVYTDETTGEPMLRQRLGWVKGEDKPQLDKQVLPPMPLAMFPEIYEVLMADQHYAAVISDLPDNPLRHVLEPLGIKSVLFMPVFTGKKLEAVVGVEECGFERQWADGEIFFMRSLCSSLSSAIQRSRSNAAQKKLNEDLSRQTHELKISNAELEQFAYVASHDLQEPLRMITSFMTKLEDRYASQLDERARRYIDFAVDGASRMRQNILGLLQYSRVGKGDAMPEKIDLNEVMEEVCLLHQNDILESGAEIKVDPLPVVHNYLAPVVQLFNNLVSNALKYRKPDVPPLIQVSAKQEGEYWQIAIRDNGIGIDKEYLQKVFVIFQRLVPKEQYDGTGIGLAVVKKIVENLGGKVWVESTPGEGSTFYFTIRSVMN
jgi:PAS domain S-box-containing protein